MGNGEPSLCMHHGLIPRRQQHSHVRCLNARGTGHSHRSVRFPSQAECWLPPAQGHVVAVCDLPHASGEPASFPTGVKVIGSSSLLVTTGDARPGFLERGGRIVVTMRPSLVTTGSTVSSGPTRMTTPTADAAACRTRSCLHRCG